LSIKTEIGIETYTAVQKMYLQRLDELPTMNNQPLLIALS